MLKSIILSTLLVSGSLFSSDLKAEFTDAKWDGMTVPKDEVCSNFNESKIGSTPPLKVSNIPSGTAKLVFTYSDKTFTKMDNGGHGIVAYKVAADAKEISVPAQGGETFELADGFEQAMTMDREDYPELWIAHNSQIHATKVLQNSIFI